MSKTLIFGGARSGKSAYAEQLAQASGKQVVYLATAQSHDDEMQVRIHHHQQRRPADWLTVEQPLQLAQAIQTHVAPDILILVDCLTLWLSNLFFSGMQEFPEIGKIIAPELVEHERAMFLQTLSDLQSDIVLVSNEVGMGIVPQGAVSRWFVDEAGRLNQAVAAQCDQVVWVAAGLPLYLKGKPC